jgi:hypothetical protein
MMDSDSDLRSCVKLDRISIKDFTSLESKRESRNLSVALPKLPEMKPKCWLERERERERERTFWFG